ncbi:MAG TPA: CocE/NonD family hydrolase [Actinomycetota bacterium]|nr:CocE/NonD family hydrolase [Actinomycetota bacterium]
MNEPPRSEVRDGMRIDWDVPIAMDDGVVLRADVFRPPDDEPAPVLISYGPYGKGLHFAEGYPDAWNTMVSKHPDVAAGSSNRYQAWEVCDPEKWVPHGYACVRVDARGWGRSPGYIEPYSPRGSRDFHDCIEWAGTQPWSSGKVGLLGISYYAITQWLVAGLQPPHLTAMIPWEGVSDFYRDMFYHGGMLCQAVDVWYRRTTTTVQHGLGERGARSAVTGELVTGPETLSDEELAANRSDYPADVRAHPLVDAWHRERSARWDDVVVPFLSAGNWGGGGRHLRGNVEGFVRAASERKWLEIHGLEHWTEFYTDHGVSLQRRFFDHFLKGVDNGWDEQPKVMLRVRTIDGGFIDRTEDDWPIPRTRWTTKYLDARTMALRDDAPEGDATVSFEALDGPGVTFTTDPFAEETEITGPSSLRVAISSTTTDADLFVVLRLYDPDGDEVVFQGAVDPHTPFAQGWLRASHRRTDPSLGTEARPYHTHDVVEPLTPGEVYDLEIEIWPTSAVVPAGYRLGVTIRGTDYEYGGTSEAAQLSHFKGSKMRGVGIYTHADPVDRPSDVFGGTTTIHVSDGRRASLVLPVIPPRVDGRHR